MPLSREQREIIENQYLIDIFDKMEADMISDLARRVQKTGRLTETAEIYARNLRELGYSPDQILQQVMQQLNADTTRQMEIAEETNAYKRDVAEIIKQTEAEALQAGDMLTATAGDMNWNEDVRLWSEHGVDLKKDNALAQIVNAVQEQTRGAIQNITGTTMRMQVGNVTLPNLYQNALDLCTIKMCAGISYQQAINETIRKYAALGITVKGPSGRNYHLDTAARMAVRTGIGQLCGKITEHNLSKTGTDLVYVDAHAGARPEHAVWQGKVYVYNGTNASKYPQYGDFYNETDYGSVTGLQGVNCMHNFYPYWPGDPIPEFKEPDPVNIGGKEYTYYDCTQEQRKEERAIRQTKRELDAAKALGDKESVKKLQQKLSEQMTKYTSFSNSANLRPKYERLPVLKADTSRNIETRTMANGGRKSASLIVTPDQQDEIKNIARKIEIPVSKLSFNTGKGTSFDESTGMINVRGNVYPDLQSSKLRDKMGIEEVLAHEYYGHFKSHPSQFRPGDWRDEFRASYNAAINTPNLTEDQRRNLMLDAYDRAKEAGVKVKYNKIAELMIYGYNTN